MWKVRVSAPDGMCTLRLAEGPNDNELDVLMPLDGTGSVATGGAFPCGRKTGASEGKEVKFPRGFTCDACFLQMVFKSKAGGEQYMCADIRVLKGAIADCSGQCMNGGVCQQEEGGTGACKCRAGYEGEFCQITQYVPQTNYTKYLKIFLFFMIMILITIGLLVGAYMLMNAAGKALAEHYRNQ